MPENGSSLVLRSINLPSEMDEELRRVAFLLKRPKSEIIRWCIERGLSELHDRIGSSSEAELDQRDILFESEVSQNYSQTEREARQADFRRMSDAAVRWQREPGGN